MAGIMDFFFGNDAKLEPFDLFSKGQTDFMSQSLQRGQGAMGAGFDQIMKMLGGDQQSLDEFSAPYMRQFNTQILPGIFERFGGGDSGASSGLMNAATEAGAGLQGQIASDRQKMMPMAMQSLMSMMGPGLTPQKGFMNQPGQPGAMNDIMKMLPMLMLLM